MGSLGENWGSQRCLRVSDSHFWGVSLILRVLGGISPQLWDILGFSLNIGVSGGFPGEGASLGGRGGFLWILGSLRRGVLPQFWGPCGY